MERSEDTESSGDGIDRLITYLTIFVLAIFVGFEVITKVPPTLHTPLMSGSNAISGITIIGAILAGVAGDVSGREFLAGGLAFAAAALAMINVVGGFAVTNRMLQMFRKKDRA
ncbi:MAG: NAD(P) transhydrogenase subunit alpha [Planctomycetota bacterium]|nr:MAG: NAD(P) transhydrogenase subunit alpha [Planctomycetota bacterium]